VKNQLDLLQYAELLKLDAVIRPTLEALPERLARYCRDKMLQRPGHWWLGGSLAGSAEEGLRRLGWVPPGAGVVASDRRGALELARLFVRKDGVSVRIYRADGRPAFSLLAPRLAAARTRGRPLPPR